jgi:hypothetical protein
MSGVIPLLPQWVFKDWTGKTLYPVTQCEILKRLYMAEYKSQWRVYVNSGLSLRRPQKAGNLLAR